MWPWRNPIENKRPNDSGKDIPKDYYKYKNMELKKIFKLIFWILPVFLSYAQGSIDSFSEVVPPSPTASSLGRYGLVPVGKFTGTAQLNIPIYELRSRKITLPISLNYATNGVKVDQIASWVGMGWSLNAGGVITRTVMDKKDENSIRIPFNDVETLRDLDLNTMETLIFNISNPDSRVDTQPDIYTYSFNDQNGKFIIGPDGIPRTIPYGDVKIEVDTSVPNTSFIITTKDGVKYYFGETQNSLPVTTEYTMLRGGTCTDDRAIIEQYDSAWYLTRIVHPSGDMIKLKYREGIDLLSEYDAGISQSYHQFLKAPNVLCQGNGAANTCISSLLVRSTVLEEIYTDNLKVRFNSSPRNDFDGFKLDAIIIEERENSLKSHRFDFSYVYSTNTQKSNIWSENLSRRLFLNELSESGTLMSNLKVHSFEYNNIDQLPVRFSFSQDYWGYFNNANNGNNFTAVPVGYKQSFPSSIDAVREPNGNFSHYGTLKKITYPTGGTTLIDYEPHTYWGEVREFRPEHTKQYYSSITTLPLSTHVYANDTVNIPSFPETPVFRAKLSCLDPVGNPCDTEEAEGYVKIKTMGGSVLNTIHLVNEYSGDAPDYKEWVPDRILSGGDYIIELHIYEPSVMGSHFKLETWFDYWNLEQPPTIEQNIQTGGVRVKRITSKANEFSIPEIERYYYRNLTDNEKSTGSKPVSPVNMRKIVTETVDQLNFNFDCDSYILSSASINSIYGVDGNHIAYSTILVSKGENFENGGEYFNYRVSSNTSGTVKNNGQVDIVYSPVFSNTGWDAGLLLGKGVIKMGLDGKFITINRETYGYKKVNEVKDIIKGAFLRQNYFPIGNPSNYGYRCKESDVGLENRPYVRKCITDHRHHYASSFFWKGWRCLSSGANNMVVYYNSSCTNRNVGDIVYHYQLLGYFELILYDILIEWQYLNKKTIVQFDDNGLNPLTTVTNYEYENPLHLQMTKSSTIGSNGSVITQKNYFPLDYDYADIPEFGPLLLNGQIGLPIDIRKEVDGKLSSGQLFKYNAKGQVIEVHQGEEEKGDELLMEQLNPYSYGNTKLKITYDGVSGNMEETTREHGVKTAYLWGYNSQFPVAKADNLDLTGLSAAIASVLGSLPHQYSTIEELLLSLNSIQTDDFQQAKWRDFNHNLREALPNSMVSTFTYDPLFGITSATDPKGQTIYYSYDSLNRLMEVRDSDGNLVTDYEYHYKD